MSALPLHVRVAEALGWTDLRVVAVLRKDSERIEIYNGWDPSKTEHTEPPNYDTDWSATGPLIDLFEIDIEHEDGDAEVTAAAWIHRPTDDPRDAAYGGRWFYEKAHGGTALEAVCKLILFLAAAGNLRAA